MVIGLTGGMATGKSTVASMFAELGAELISADDIAGRLLLRGSPLLNRVVEQFGDAILTADGSLDRSRLAGIIFSDPEARERLNSITHPLIIAELEREIGRFRASNGSRARVLIVEIPLLFECGLSHLVDKVLVAAAEQGTQECRLMNRYRLRREEASARIAAQMPVRDKVSRADRVVWTDGDLSDTRSQVEGIWAEIKAEM